MKKNKSFLILLVLSLGLGPVSYSIEDKTHKVFEWEEIVVAKDFILSKYLYNKNNCNEIWGKQVPDFIKVNPHIKNPDNIQIGQKIKVQKCIPKKVIKSSNVDLGIGTLKLNKKKIVKKKISILGESRSELMVGLLNEDKSELGVGIDIYGKIDPTKGYRFFLIASPSVALYEFKAEFRTKPAKKRYFVSLGLGQRVGLNNSDADRLSTGADSYTTLGVGMIDQKSEKSYLRAEVGVNINSRFLSPNIEISFFRKIRKTWLGFFMKSTSTKSVVDEREEDRRLFFFGIKWLF